MQKNMIPMSKRKNSNVDENSYEDETTSRIENAKAAYKNTNNNGTIQSDAIASC